MEQQLSNSSTNASVRTSDHSSQPSQPSLLPDLALAEAEHLSMHPHKDLLELRDLAERHLDHLFALEEQSANSMSNSNSPTPQTQSTSTGNREPFRFPEGTNFDVRVMAFVIDDVPYIHRPLLM